MLYSGGKARKDHNTHLCGCLSICVRQGHDTLVHLDSRDDALALQDVRKWCAISSWLEECLLKQNLQ